MCMLEWKNIWQMIDCWLNVWCEGEDMKSDLADLIRK